MARKYVRIGSALNVQIYDDADYTSGIEVDAPIKATAPVEDDHVLRRIDIETLGWPIGSVFLSVVSTNPGTLLGFGTWSQIAEGQFLVGYKSGDADFGTVEGTGGAKTHTHPVPASASVTAVTATGVDVASKDHTHTTGNNSALPPFFTIYVWKRTA